jgi:hypothetical protein
MRKIFIILTISILIGLKTPVFAQERDFLFPSISISKNAKVKLQSARKVGIFINSNEMLLKRIIEDALAIQLTNAGFISINREVLEKGVGEQVVKKQKEKLETALNALDIGKAVNADLILTGTVIIESGEKHSLLVKIASFQIVDIASGETLTSVLFEPDKGKSFSEIAKRFVDLLK